MPSSYNSSTASSLTHPYPYLVPSGDVLNLNLMYLQHDSEWERPVHVDSPFGLYVPLHSETDNAPPPACANSCMILIHCGIYLFYEMVTEYIEIQISHLL